MKESLIETGLVPAMELIGVGPHTPPPNNVFAYIAVQAGSLKCKSFGYDNDDLYHRSADGTYTGAVYAYIPGTVLSGRYTEVTGDASLHAIAYLMQPIA